MLHYDAPTAAEAAQLMEQYRVGSSFFFSSKHFVNIVDAALEAA
jgi:hypothetical protein